MQLTINEQAIKPVFFRNAARRTTRRLGNCAHGDVPHVRLVRFAAGSCDLCGRFAGRHPALIGLAVGAYGLTQAVLQIPFGAISDRIGRVPVIVFGLALFVAGSILAAQSDSIYGVIAGRLLQGAGAISATLTALLADATREAVRTRTMAIFGIAIGSSFLLALIIGPVIAAASGVRSLFWLAAALAVVAALLLLLLPGGIERPAQQSGSPAQGSDQAGSAAAGLLHFRPAHFVDRKLRRFAIPASQ